MTAPKAGRPKAGRSKAWRSRAIDPRSDDRSGRRGRGVGESGSPGAGHSKSGAPITRSADSGKQSAINSARSATPRLSRVITARAGDRPWRAWIIAGGWLLLVWFALWGAITPMLAITGIAGAILALALFPLPVVQFTFGLHPVRAFILAGRFLLDVVTASVQVAWLAIRIRPPRSAVTTVQLRSTSDLIQTLTSLAVSLVPGSLIIDADPDQRTLKIHVLDPGTGGLAKFHQRVLDQEERIVRALGGTVEIEAVMGIGEPDERAVYVGHIAWGAADPALDAHLLDPHLLDPQLLDVQRVVANLRARHQDEVVMSDAEMPASDRDRQKSEAETDRLERNSTPGEADR